MPRKRLLAAFGLCLTLASNAVAQDQTIIVDQPLQLCGTGQQFPSATFDEATAEALIKAALGLQNVDPTTYYVIHATQFVDRRMVVATEHWYVYHKPWQEKPAFWWLRDSRQLKHFRETRIFGSSRVAIVYLYTNVPTYSSRNSLEDVARFFLARRAALAERGEAVRETITRFRDRLPPEAERAAEAAASTRAAAARKAAGNDKDALKVFSDTEDLYPLAALEAELYFKALAEQQDSAELPLINRDSGEVLKGLSPTLATTDTFKSLVNLFYKIEVTKKLPAPLENLKAAAKLAFGGQSGAADRLAVEVRPAAVCAGRQIEVDHVPSDMLVKAMIGAEDDETPSERTHQLFDNEGRYWWDVSFAVPLNLRRDLSIDVDAGQVAAKDVEKADVFAVVNLGMPRDTKRIQWQLVPTFVYGIPITGKPLKHHLVGITVGLNYVQLLAGVRFDRRQVISTTTENGTPVGVETTPPGEKWEHKFVWGLNLPVNTVVKMFKK